MANNWPSDPDAVMRGLWGNLVAARESGGGSAANIWSALQSGAQAWAEGVLAITSVQPPTEAEIALQAQQLIGNVTIQDVNRYNQIAGQFIAAKNNLMNLSVEQQIMGSEIFTPPWSTTAFNPAVPDRYRIRVLFDVTVHGFSPIDRQEWSTYELTSPLTSVNDALQQAIALYGRGESKGGRADVNDVLQYSIEQI